MLGLSEQKMLSHKKDLHLSTGVNDLIDPYHQKLQEWLFDLQNAKKQIDLKSLGLVIWTTKKILHLLQSDTCNIYLPF